MTSGFVTCITNFLIIIRITYPTPICRTAPSTLSRGMSRFAKIASIPRGSINSVHKRRVIAAIAAHRSVPDFFNDFDARTRRNPFASTPMDPQNLLLAERHPVPFTHLSVGKLSLEHFRLARRAKI